jgi:C-terminal processing protease CtpA/Prc
VHGAPAGGAHRLKVRDPKGSLREVHTPAWNLAQREADRSTAFKPPAADAPAWQWQMRSDGVALLTMDGWAIYNSQWNWQAWLNERLDELAGDKAARGLVVDIRQNEGGLDCGNLILARVLKEPSALPQRRLLRFRSVPEALRPQLDTWDKSFFSLGENASVFDERFFELPAANTVVQPSGQRINLPVVVLTSATNSSATYAFAQRCKQSGAARLVGETTGGNLRGINGGAFFFVRLPASGLAFDLPLIGFFPHTPQPDAGVQPDVAAAATAADIASGRDPVLEGALSMMLKA